jgi:hypothetical protein
VFGGDSDDRLLWSTKNSHEMLTKVSMSVGAPANSMLNLAKTSLRPALAGWHSYV